MKKYALKRNKDFKFLFNKGNKCHSGSMLMLYHRSRALKVGISVSKKHGKSVVRNRIKRLIRAAFIRLKGQIKPCYNIVFLPRVKDSYSFDVFFEDMKKMLGKEGMLND